jgi:hypothetical protein
VQPPKSFTSGHPRFRIPGWQELLGPDELIDAQDMVRHFLMTGETGSGKSASGVLRLLEGILRYPEEEPYRRYAKAAGEAAEPEDQLRPSVLVIDPKQELEALVRQEAHGRKITRLTYREKGPVMHLFEGWSNIEASSAVDFILQQSDFFVNDQARTDEPIWSLQAASLIKDMVSVDLWLSKAGRLNDFWRIVAKTLTSVPEIKSFAAALRYDRANYFRAPATLIALSAEGDSSDVMGAYLQAGHMMDVPGDLMVRLMSLESLAHTTRSCVVWMANGILQDLSSDDLASCVSLNPIEGPEDMLSVHAALNNGDAVVYVPSESTGIADLIGRCLKAKFFEFSFKRENQVRPFFYVVDEAHRFLTSGQQDGEQNLLDRCRAFRVGVVLATQSLASMAYRLSGPNGRYALQIMLNNCGNALYFRTPDVETQDNLSKRIPNPPVQGRPHVLAVRPLTSLSVGSCYALRSNGSWGLFQVHLPGATVS